VLAEVVHAFNPSTDWTPESTGKWTAEEDATLTNAIEKHGDNWVKVAALVPGRMHEQCRQRRSLHYNGPQEDAKPLDAINKCGEDWVTVTTLIPCRTNLQCPEKMASRRGR
jgi:hypothetical protein